MLKYDHVIYEQIDGKMTKIAEPRGRVENPNFVITWNGRDWSGFRTLAKCEAQFTELERRKKEAFGPFAVVER